MKISVPKDLGRGPVVPSGIYRATVTEYKVGTSQTGNPKINITLTIQSQGPDESVKTIGRKIFDTLSMTEKALGIVNGKFKALTGNDLPVGDFEIDEFMNMITSQIMNRDCLIQVEVEAGDQGERNTVKRMTKIEG